MPWHPLSGGGSNPSPFSGGSARCAPAGRPRVHTAPPRTGVILLVGTRPIRFYAFRVKGVDHPKLAEAIVGALRADATTSPTESQVTLAGRTLTKVAYSQGPAEYLLEAAGGVVFDIETTDETLASKVLPLLE